MCCIYVYMYMYGIYIHALLCFWYIIKWSHIHAKYSACLLCFTIIPSIYCPFLPRGKATTILKTLHSLRFPSVLFEDIRNPSNFLLTNLSKCKKGIIQNFWPGQKRSKLIMFFGTLGPSPCSISFFKSQLSILTKNQSLRLLMPKDPKTDRSLYT